MILPIHIIGSPVLRKKAKDIDRDYPSLSTFIENLKETMYSSDGVGLAAPQTGRSVRVFIIDASPFADEYPDLANFKKVFINAQITKRSEEKISSNEGCLSIPDIREDVSRSNKITIKYLDENFEAHEEEYEGMAAVIIQHEYDHLEGILFTDKIAPIRRKLLKVRLVNISKGKFEKRYKYILKTR